MTEDKRKRMINALIRLAAVLLLAFLIGRFLGNENGPSGSQETQSQAQNQTQSQTQTQAANGTSLTDGADGSEENERTEEIYTFRNRYLREEHFKKHGNEFDYRTPEEYEAGASAVVNNPAALHKTEAEDGDDVYYIEKTNEFVVVSVDGCIRTYFKPHDGIRYYNRQ